jgi:hypothetical protein
VAVELVAVGPVAAGEATEATDGVVSGAGSEDLIAADGCTSFRYTGAVVGCTAVV